jgi:hypothetical protein
LNLLAQSESHVSRETFRARKEETAALKNLARSAKPRAGRSDRPIEAMSEENWREIRNGAVEGNANYRYRIDYKNKNQCGFDFLPPILPPIQFVAGVPVPHSDDPYTSDREFGGSFSYHTKTKIRRH